MRPSVKSRTCAKVDYFPDAGFSSTGFTGCGRSRFCRHSERSEESLFDWNPGKEGFLGEKRASEWRLFAFFRSLFSLWGLVAARSNVLAPNPTGWSLCYQNRPWQFSLFSWAIQGFHGRDC